MYDDTIEIEVAVTREDRERLMEKIRRLIDQFVPMADVYTPAQVATFERVIGRMLVQIGPAACAEMAPELAREPKAPPGVIKELARDDRIEIAESVLIHSEALDDIDLVEIVETKPQTHLLAVSKRRKLGTSVADALLEHGSLAVLKSLARNTGAELSANGRALLSQKVRAVQKERRGSPRKTVNYPGSVFVDDVGDALTCTLVDISKTGARIALATPQKMPEAVTLSFAGGGVTRHCRVVWQAGPMVGLCFIVAE